MTHSSQRHRLLKLGVSTAALAIALAACSAAVAQTTPSEESAVEAVVVTGFRASLQSALNVKRNETAVVDAIKAEDIADFPDTNLAEAIQRIPGVSIDRDAGEGRTLTVRGLGQDFTRTRINGMEAQATTGATDSSGGANRGRGFDFNVFASELFNSVTIRKTAAAEVEEGSLGATVDLQTARPFDYRGFAAAGSVQGSYNDLSKSWDPRFAALISNTWDDGRFGLLGSVAYSKRSSYEEGFSSVRWVNASGTGGSGGFCSPLGVTPQNPGNNTGAGSSASNCSTNNPRPANTTANVAAYTAANAATTFIPRLPRFGRLVHDQERLGLTGSAQWRPSDTTKVSFDVLYSHLEATRQENFLEALSFSRNQGAGGQTEIIVNSATVAPNGTLVAGNFDNVDIRSEQRYDELTTDFTQGTLTVEHEFSDRFRVRGLVGQAVSKFDNPIQTTVTIDRQNVDGFAWDFTGNKNVPLLTWGFDPAVATNWTWRDLATFGNLVSSLPRSEIRLRPNTVDTTFNTAQLDFTFDINDDFRLKFGANEKKFESISTDLRRTDETAVPTLPAGVTIANITQPLSGFGVGLGLPAGSTTNWIVPNLDVIASTFDIYCNCDTGVTGGDFRLTGITNGNARGGNRTINEDSRGAYIQIEGSVPAGSMTVRGNFGFRYVHTELTAAGFSSTGGGTAVSGQHKYRNLLPSLNVAVDVTDKLIVRFGAAQVMARPQIGNTLAGTNYLVPTTSLSTTGGSFTASIGNVKLNPFKADTVDFSVEWYFAPESLLSVALFYKGIDSYIQIIRQDLPYSELTAFNPSAFDASFCTGAVGGCTASTVFQLTSARNTQGGPLRGYEINYQQPLSFLPGPFSDLGVILNYTHVESSIAYCDTRVNALCTTFVTDQLVNLSPNAYNATLYYENSTFSARVSAAYRDRYLQNVPGRNNNLVEGKDESLTIDTAASYNITPKLALTFEGLNLTDEDTLQFVGNGTDRENTSVFHHTGRQFFVGARYKF